MGQPPLWMCFSDASGRQHQMPSQAVFARLSQTIVAAKFVGWTRIDGRLVGMLGPIFRQLRFPNGTKFSVSASRASRFFRTNRALPKKPNVHGFVWPEVQRTASFSCAVLGNGWFVTTRPRGCVHKGMGMVVRLLFSVTVTDARGPNLDRSCRATTMPPLRSMPAMMLT